MTTRLVPVLGILLSVVSALLLIRYVADPVSIADAVDLRGQREVSVVLTETGFVPERLRVNAGTVVVFSTERTHQFWPASNPHPSHTIYDQFDPNRPIAPGDTWSFVAEKPGAWGFHDHLRSFYTGILYVE